MSIISGSFLLFVLCAVCAYYLVPLRARWTVLLLASAGFYASLGFYSCAFVGVTAVFTYFAGRVIGVLAAKKPSGEGEKLKADKKRLTRRKRAALALALILNFSVLFVLKYLGFSVSVISVIFNSDIHALRILAPVGVSFYIFMSSAYLIDIQRGKIAPEKNFLKYALFLCYFPQIVQGPINVYQDMRERLFEGNAFKLENVQNGVFRMMFGILKKVLVADRLSATVAAIYGGYTQYPGAICFLGAFLYCVQLYCDFSGGIDLVCGVSSLFGIPMQENFRQPFFAVSLADFWRRWHISLGEWMKNYLFYPLTLGKPFARLSKAARKRLPQDIAKRAAPCLATFIVFLAVGVWQGPGWANVAYGLWNGFWMSLGMMWVPYGTKLKKRFPVMSCAALMTALGVIRTNVLVIFGRYFSNADSLRQALGMIGRTFTAFGSGGFSAGLFAQLGLTPLSVCETALALLGIFAVGLAKEKGVSVSGWICGRKWYLQFIILFFGIALVVWFLFANSGYVPIAYVYENV